MRHARGASPLGPSGSELAPGCACGYSARAWWRACAVVEPNGLAELVLFGGAGLGFGALHVLSPDHWVALLPLSLDAGRRGWRVGLQWGLGHALGLIGLALVAQGLREWLDLNLLGVSGEWLIGIVLIGIGVWGLAHRGHSATPSHAPDSSEARGPSGRLGLEAQCPHGPSALRTHSHSQAHVHTGVAFGVGLVHAFGGIGVFLVALPTLGFDGWGQIAAYVIGFASGTIVAMGAFSALLGTLAVRIDPDGRFGDRYRRVFRGTCWFAITAGVIWLIGSDWLHDSGLLMHAQH